MTSSEHGPHRGGGFSLLEVMGAVALLGLMFTIAASLAMTTVVREGTAMRRMEAAMIADQEIAMLEALVVAGSAPADTSEEREEDLFTISIEVYPVPLPTVPLGDAAGALGVGFDVGTQLGIPASALENLLKQIDIEVIWTEGHAERSVKRTTFAFDMAAWAAIAPAAPTNSGNNGGNDARNGQGNSGDPGRDSQDRP